MGPMFAGKTSELLRRVEDHEVPPCSIPHLMLLCCISKHADSQLYNFPKYFAAIPSTRSKTSEFESALHIDCNAIVLQAAGRKVALVKSSIDTRYHSARIVTHDGHSKVCLRQRPCVARVHSRCMSGCLYGFNRPASDGLLQAAPP